MPTHKLFEVLYAHQSGILELRAFDDKIVRLRDFIPIENGVFDASRIDKFLRTTKSKDLDAYFGVSLRTQNSLKDQRGDAEHCQTLTCLFIDADFKYLGEEATLQHITEFDIQPTVLVHSGGGFHAYWVLNDPVELTIEWDRGADLLQRIAYTFEDIADTEVSEPTRVLRIPGSINFKPKYDKPKVHIVGKPTDETYDSSFFGSELDDTPPPGDDATGTWTVPTEIRTGDRHGQLFKLLRSQKARGLGLEAALASCHATNKEICDPPIPFDVLETYLRRCWDQKDRAEFRPPKGFNLNAKDRIISNDQQNIAVALSRLQVELSRDLFAGKNIVKSPHFSGTMQDDDIDEIWLEMERQFRFRPTKDYFYTVLRQMAKSNPFHPVRDYLKSQKWDKKPRLDEWVIKSAKASDNDYVRAVSALILIAAVRRILHPGCKFDEMLVLESDQGLNKSTALRALCPNESWFSDDLPLNVDSKQVIERTQGKLIIEAMELSGLRQSEQIKSMLSRQIDGPVRMAYARIPVEIPRQFIIIGTTNSHAYLRDQTGNRRFWPVRVGKFDVEWIERNRDQIWAEAYWRELANESIRLKPTLYSVAQTQQERRMHEDSWEETINAALEEGYERRTSGEIWDILGIPVAARNDAGVRRISAIMQRLDFRRMTVRPREGGKAQKGWGRADKLID